MLPEKKDKPDFIDQFTDAVNRFFKSVGALFVKGYRKYDAFIRRIFKLDMPVQKNEQSHRDANHENELEELHTYARQRKPQLPDYDEYDEQVSDYDMGKTQSYNYLPDYLQQKTYDEPAPLADLEPRRHDEPDDHHHWNIFKKRQRPRNFFTSVLLGLVKIVIALMLIMGTSGPWHYTRRRKRICGYNSGTRPCKNRKSGRDLLHL